MRNCVLSTIILLLSFTLLAAKPKILVDCLHGYDETYTMATQYPNYEFVKLDKAMIPMQNIIYSDSISTQDTISFTIGANVPELYAVTNQSPYSEGASACLLAPNGVLYFGFKEVVSVEDPLAGEWKLIAYGCTKAKIGIGAKLFDSVNLTGYDAVVRFWSNKMVIFYGALIDYSAYDLSKISQAVNSGTGFVNLYNYRYGIALKPVVRIYNLSESADLTIKSNGFLSYDKPKAKETKGNQANDFSWNIRPNTKSPFTEILYESAYTNSPDFVSHQVQGNSVSFNNISPYPLYSPMIIKSMPNQKYLVATGNDLSAGQSASLSPAIMTESDLREFLNTRMQSVMIDRNLKAEDVKAFFADYHWIDKILHDAVTSSDFLALYLLDDQAYNSIFPMQLNQPVSKIVRQMWMEEKNLSQYRYKPYTELTPVAPQASKSGAEYYEYGLFDKDYDHTPMDFFGLKIDNSRLINDHIGDNWDETIFNNLNDSHYITENINTVYSYSPPHVRTKTGWTPLIKGSSNYTLNGPDDIFNGGDTLCCLSASVLGKGKMVVGGACDLLLSNYGLDNISLGNKMLEYAVRSANIFVPTTTNPTIQAAINHAVNGNIILVKSGIYRENLDFLGKNIQIISEKGSDSTFIIPPATVSPDTSKNCIVFNKGENKTARLAGFTIKRSSNSAIYIKNSSPIIENCVIDSCDMDAWYKNGAAIKVDSSHAEIRNCSFTGNADAYLGGAIFLNNWFGLVSGCEFKRNTMFSGYGVDYGSAIYIANSQGKIIGCKVHDNFSDMFVFGAIHLNNSATIINSCKVYNNNSPAFSAEGTDLFAVNNNEIINNYFYHNGGVLYEVSCAPFTENRTYNFRNNYWNNDVYSEMNLVGWPGNITKIYDKNDNSQIGTIDYSNWQLVNAIAEQGKPDSKSVQLLANYPNPFNNTTIIQYQLPSNFSGRVKLSVYNSKGELVTILKDAQQNAGLHSCTFDAAKVAGGLYFYKLEAGKNTAVRKMMLIK